MYFGPPTPRQPYKYGPIPYMPLENILVPCMPLAPHVINTKKYTYMPLSGTQGMSIKSDDIPGIFPINIPRPVAGQETHNEMLQFHTKHFVVHCAPFLSLSVLVHLTVPNIWRPPFVR
jgi:hypothetical protein